MTVTARRGFSLVEMLMTTLILSLAMVIVVSGSSVAQKIYRNTMAKADAQMILSQIERNLRDDLSFADQCRLDADGTTVTQYHKNGLWYTLANGTKANQAPYENFLYRTFRVTDSNGEFEDDDPILYEPLSSSNSNRLEEVSVSLPKITYSDGRFQVSNLRVRLDAADTGVLAGADDDTTPYLIIHALNKVECVRGG